MDQVVGETSKHPFPSAYGILTCAHFRFPEQRLTRTEALRGKFYSSNGMDFGRLPTFFTRHDDRSSICIFH
jgi:hypothetical protein